LLSTSRSWRLSFSSYFLNKTLYTFLRLRATCHAYLWFGHLNDIWRVEVTKLFSTQSTPVSCYLVPLGSKCLPQRPILKQPKPTFFPQAKFQTHFKQKETCSFVYFSFYILRQQKGR
jgi:hypothetical protein